MPQCYSFLWLSNIPPYIYVYHIFIHLSVVGHLGYFHVLAIVNGAAMNIRVHVSFQILFFSRYMPRSGVAESHGSSSLVDQTVKNLPAMWETWVWSLGWEDLLEKGMATHSSITTWRIPWTEEPGRLQCMGLQRVRQLSNLQFFSLGNSSFSF